MPRTVRISKSPFADTYVGKAGRLQDYPWESLLNGKIWVLDPYLEYGVEVESFRVLAHKAASNKGLKIKTHIEGHRFYLYAKEV